VTGRLTLLDILGVVLIGFIWQHVGALQNPMFSRYSRCPSSAQSFCPAGIRIFIAAVSVIAVAAVALSQAPELRWYASGLLGTDKWLTWLFGNQSAVPQPSFSGFFAPSNYLIVLLEVFAILLFACAVAAEYVGTIFERLNAHIIMARTEAERGQEMWAGLIERLPLPALLIDPDSMRVVASSEYATIYLRQGELPIEGRPLFEALKFLTLTSCRS